MRRPLLAVSLVVLAVLAACGQAKPNTSGKTPGDPNTGCTATTTSCGTTLCIDTRTDASNCGACGIACTGGQACSAGACGCPATAPLACGSGAATFCANVQTDPDNCGGCGRACHTQCQAGVCAVSNAIATDILFVMDDSSSMEPKQDAVAIAFDGFIEELARANVARAAQGLAAFEFHVAVTTSSVFRNYGTGDFQKTYDRCMPTFATAGAEYPQGDFIAVPGTAKVAHFVAGLSPAAVAQAVAGVKANLRVGSCGSSQEQHLEAARLALQKVAGGRQPGLTPGEFGHPGAKLLVVWVGDEDDCSSPADPARALVLTDPASAGADACVRDRSLPAAQQKLFKVAEYDAFFTSLLQVNGGPYASMGAGFVVSANRCTDGLTCAPADALQLQSPATCTGTAQFACSGASGAGVRFLALADTFRGRGVNVVEATVCEDLAKPLSRLTGFVTAP